MDILLAAYILLATFFFIAIGLSLSLTRNVFDVSKRSQNILQRTVIEKDGKTENNAVLSEHFLSFTCYYPFYLLYSILPLSLSLFLSAYFLLFLRYRRDKIVLFPREAYIITRAIVSRGKPEREKRSGDEKKIPLWAHLTQNERGMTVQP